MSLVYDESVRTGGVGFDTSKFDAVKGYMTHYANKLYLCFMAKNGTRDERWQAEKELQICERKLKWWSNHPNYDSQAVQRLVEKMNKEWRP